MNLLVLVIAIAIGAVAHTYSKQKDSPLEEFAEEVIENELGLPDDSIDFSAKKKKNERE